MYKTSTDQEKIFANHTQANDYCPEYTKDYYEP